jgi:hypothetical protein
MATAGFMTPGIATAPDWDIPSTGLIKEGMTAAPD